VGRKAQAVKSRQHRSSTRGNKFHVREAAFYTGVNLLVHVQDLCSNTVNRTSCSLNGKDATAFTLTQFGVKRDTIKEIYSMKRD
jgi:hypothetical protein